MGENLRTLEGFRISFQREVSALQRVMSCRHSTGPSSKPDPGTESLPLNTGPHSHKKGLKASGTVLSGWAGMRPGRGELRHPQQTGFLGQPRKDTQAPVMSQIRLGRRIYWAESFENTNSLRSAPKRNELLMHMGWVNLKIIMLNERRQTKANIHCMIILRQNSGKCQ